MVERVSLLKMDFLGLRTLTTVNRAIKLVKQTKGLDIDIEKIDFAGTRFWPCSAAAKLAESSSLNREACRTC